jgi:hypothetical protein
MGFLHFGQFMSHFISPPHLGHLAMQPLPSAAQQAFPSPAQQPLPSLQQAPLCAAISSEHFISAPHLPHLAVMSPHFMVALQPGHFSIASLQVISLLQPLHLAGWQHSPAACAPPDLQPESARVSAIAMEQNVRVSMNLGPCSFSQSVTTAVATQQPHRSVNRARRPELKLDG